MGDSWLLNPVVELRDSFESLPEVLRRPVEMVVFGGDLPRADISAMRQLAADLRANGAELGEHAEAADTLLAQEDSVGELGDSLRETLGAQRDGAAQLDGTASALADQAQAAANDAEKTLCVMLAFGIQLAWKIFGVLANASAAGPAGQVAAAPVVESMLAAGRSRIAVLRAGLEQALKVGAANTAARLAELGPLRFATVVGRAAALPVAVDAGAQAFQIASGERSFDIIGSDGTNPTGIDLTSIQAAALSGGAGAAGGMLAGWFVPAAFPRVAGSRLALGLVHGTAGAISGLGAASLVTGWPEHFDHVLAPLLNGALAGAAYAGAPASSSVSRGPVVDGTGAFVPPGSGSAADGGDRAVSARPGERGASSPGPDRPRVEISTEAKRQWGVAVAAWAAAPQDSGNAHGPGFVSGSKESASPLVAPAARSPAVPDLLSNSQGAARGPGVGEAAAATAGRSEGAGPSEHRSRSEAVRNTNTSVPQSVTSVTETAPPPKSSAVAPGRPGGDASDKPGAFREQRASEPHQQSVTGKRNVSVEDSIRATSSGTRTAAGAGDGPDSVGHEKQRGVGSAEPAPPVERAHAVADSGSDSPTAARSTETASEPHRTSDSAEHRSAAHEDGPDAKAPVHQERPGTTGGEVGELAGSVRSPRDQAADLVIDFHMSSAERVPEHLRLQNLGDEVLRAGLFDGDEKQSLLATMEIIRRGTVSDAAPDGIVLRFEQVEGLYALNTRPVEMKPGEGKSLMFMAAAVQRAAHGGSCLLVTTTDGLAYREFAKYQRLMTRYGIDVFRADQQRGFGPVAEDGRPAIVVATGETVGHLCNAGHSPPRRTLIDECDGIIDRGERVFLRSEGTDRAASEATAREVFEAHDFLADALASGALSHTDFGLRQIIDEVGVRPDRTPEIEYWYAGRASLTPESLVKVEALPGGNKWLEGLGLSRLETAAAAEFSTRNKTHYVMDAGKIVIIDQGEHGLQRNPMTSSESRWSAEPGKASLAQAVEAKEIRAAESAGMSAEQHGIQVRADAESATRIDSVEIYRRGGEFFDEVTGASGTLADLNPVLKTIYGLEGVHEVARSQSQRLLVGEADVVANTYDKLSTISAGVHHIWSGGSGRAQEILCHRNDLVERQVAALVREGVPREAIEAVDADRIAGWGADWEVRLQRIFDEAGAQGKILVINRQGQRGVDIPVSEDVLAQGGMHVWLTETPEQSYIAEQAMNRTARNGAPGTAQMLMSPQDALIRNAMHLQGVRETVVQYEQAAAAHRSNPTAENHSAVLAAGKDLGALAPELQERALRHSTADFIRHHAHTTADPASTLAAAETGHYRTLDDPGLGDEASDRTARMAGLLGLPAPVIADRLAAFDDGSVDERIRALLDRTGIPPAAAVAIQQYVSETAPARVMQNAAFTDEQALRQLIPQRDRLAAELSVPIADIEGAEGLRTLDPAVSEAKNDLARLLGYPVSAVDTAVARDILGEAVDRHATGVRTNEAGDGVDSAPLDSEQVSGKSPVNPAAEEIVAAASHYLATTALFDLVTRIHRRNPNSCVNNAVTAMRVLCPGAAARFAMPTMSLTGHDRAVVQDVFGSVLEPAESLDDVLESLKSRPGGISVLTYRWKDPLSTTGLAADNHLVLLVNDSDSVAHPNPVVVDLAASRDGDSATDYGALDLRNRRALLNKAVGFDEWRRKQQKFLDKVPANAQRFETIEFDHKGYPASAARPRQASAAQPTVLSPRGRVSKQKPSVHAQKTTVGEKKRRPVSVSTSPPNRSSRRSRKPEAGQAPGGTRAETPHEPSLPVLPNAAGTFGSRPHENPTDLNAPRIVETVEGSRRDTIGARPSEESDSAPDPYTPETATGATNGRVQDSENVEHPHQVPGPQDGESLHDWAARTAPSIGLADVATPLDDQYVQDWLTDHDEQMRAWRRYIHHHAEASGNEYGTARYVFEVLQEAGLDPRLVLDGRGVICDFGPDTGEGIALRADMDALTLDVDGQPQVLHACGHDAHTAMVLAAGMALASNPGRLEELGAKVRLVFQPAEETGKGAREMVLDGLLDGYERTFALHCDPRLPAGQFGVVVGPMNASADELTATVEDETVESSARNAPGDRFTVDFKAPGGHTAHPEESVDLIRAMAEFTAALRVLLTGDSDVDRTVEAIFGKFQAGEKMNAIPDFGRIEGEISRPVVPYSIIRHFLEQKLREVEEKYDRLSAELAAYETDVYPEGSDGRTGRPEGVVDAIAAFTRDLDDALTERFGRDGRIVTVFGKAEAGYGDDGSPGAGALLGTIRRAGVEKADVDEFLQGRLAELDEQFPGMRFNLQLNELVPTVVNDPESILLFMKAISVLGPDAAAAIEMSMGGDDFAHMINRVPKGGAYVNVGIWSGNGDKYSLHQPPLGQDEHALDERALAYGARALAGTVLAAGSVTTPPSDRIGSRPAAHREGVPDPQDGEGLPDRVAPNGPRIDPADAGKLRDDQWQLATDLADPGDLAGRFPESVPVSVRREVVDVAGRLAECVRAQIGDEAALVVTGSRDVDGRHRLFTDLEYVRHDAADPDPGVTVAELGRALADVDGRIEVDSDRSAPGGRTRHRVRIDLTKQRILVFTSRWGVGGTGVEALSAALCEGLVQAGHQVTVRSDSSGGADRVPGVRVHRAGSVPTGSPVDLAIVQDVDNAVEAAREVQRHHPGARLVLARHLTPMLFTRLHGRPERGRAMVAAGIYVSRRADLVTGLGPALAMDALSEATMAGHGSVHELQPGLVLAEQPPEPAPDAPVRILLSGRASDPLKGVSEIAGVVRELRAQGRDVRLVVRGYAWSEMYRARSELTWLIGDSVAIELKPRTSDRAALQEDIREATVVVMPSQAEGFGLVATQAIEQGVPVLVPSSSGVGRFLAGIPEYRAWAEQFNLVEQPLGVPPDGAAWLGALGSLLVDVPGAWAVARRAQEQLRPFTRARSAKMLLHASLNSDAHARQDHRPTRSRVSIEGGRVVVRGEGEDYELILDVADAMETDPAVLRAVTDRADIVFAREARSRPDNDAHDSIGGRPYENNDRGPARPGGESDSVSPFVPVGSVADPGDDPALVVAGTGRPALSAVSFRTPWTSPGEVREDGSTRPSSGDEADPDSHGWAADMPAERTDAAAVPRAPLGEGPDAGAEATRPEHTDSEQDRNRGEGLIGSRPHADRDLGSVEPAGPADPVAHSGHFIGPVDSRSGLPTYTLPSAAVRGEAVRVLRRHWGPTATPEDLTYRWARQSTAKQAAGVAESIDRAAANEQIVRALSNHELRILVRTWPESIGRAGGFPRAVRDQANRWAFAKARAGLADPASSTTPTRREHQLREYLANVEDLLIRAGHRASAVQTPGVAAPAVLLESFDAENPGAGSVTVSLGRPDAVAEAWHVDGSDGDLRRLDQRIQLACNHYETAARENPDRPVRVVVWSGTDGHRLAGEMAAPRDAGGTGRSRPERQLVVYGDGGRPARKALAHKGEGIVDTLVVCGESNLTTMRDMLDDLAPSVSVYVGVAARTNSPAEAMRVPGVQFSCRFPSAEAGRRNVLSNKVRQSVQGVGPPAFHHGKDVDDEFLLYVDDRAKAATESLENIGRILAGRPDRVKAFDPDDGPVRFGDYIRRGRPASDEVLPRDPDTGNPALRTTDADHAFARAAIEQRGGPAAEPSVLSHRGLPDDFTRAARLAADNWRWWDELPAAQRRAVVGVHPEVVGNAPGIPSAVTDYANDLWRMRTFAALYAKGSTGTDPAERTTFRNLYAVQEALTRAASVHRDVPEPIVATVRLAPDAFGGNGSGVFSVGNCHLDEAEHVVWYVDGVNTRLQTAPDRVLSARNLYEEMMRADPSRKVAVVAWLGYEAPANNKEAWAARPELAEAGGRWFARDVLALRAVSTAEFSVLGYSYGTPTVSEATVGGRLDGMFTHRVVVGSPGLGRRYDSTTDASHRYSWVVALSDDPVTGLGTNSPGLRGRVLGDGPLGLGTDPATDTTATRLPGERCFPESLDTVDGHGEYLEYSLVQAAQPTESLHSVAWCLAGRGNELIPDPHRPTVDDPTLRHRIRGELVDAAASRRAPQLHAALAADTGSTRPPRAARSGARPLGPDPAAERGPTGPDGAETVAPDAGRVRPRIGLQLGSDRTADVWSAATGFFDAGADTLAVSFGAGAGVGEVAALHAACWSAATRGATPAVVLDVGKRWSDAEVRWAVSRIADIVRDYDTPWQVHASDPRVLAAAAEAAPDCHRVAWLNSLTIATAGLRGAAGWMARAVRPGAGDSAAVLEEARRTGATGVALPHQLLSAEFARQADAAEMSLVVRGVAGSGAMRAVLEQDVTEIWTDGVERLALLRAEVAESGFGGGRFTPDTDRIGSRPHEEAGPTVDGVPGPVAQVLARVLEPVLPESMTPADVQKWSGFAEADIRRIRDAAAAHGFTVDLRSSNPDGLAWRAAGALPKPEWMSYGTGTELDVLLGMDPANRGLAVIFEPVLPPHTLDIPPEHWRSLLSRYHDRSKDWQEFTASRPGGEVPFATGPEVMEFGMVDETGAVYRRGDDGRLRPVTSDYDVVAIRESDGRLVSTRARYLACMRVLMSLGVPILHGAQSQWLVLFAGHRAKKIKLGKRIQPGGEPVVRIEPGRPLRAVWGPALEELLGVADVPNEGRIEEFGRALAPPTVANLSDHLHLYKMIARRNIEVLRENIRRTVVGANIVLPENLTEVLDDSSPLSLDHALRRLPANLANDLHDALYDWRADTAESMVFDESAIVLLAVALREVGRPPEEYECLTVGADTFLRATIEPDAAGAGQLRAIGNQMSRARRPELAEALIREYGGLALHHADGPVTVHAHLFGDAGYRRGTVIFGYTGTAPDPLGPGPRWAGIREHSTHEGAQVTALFEVDEAVVKFDDGGPGPVSAAAVGSSSSPVVLRTPWSGVGDARAVREHSGSNPSPELRRLCRFAAAEAELINHHMVWDPAVAAFTYDLADGRATVELRTDDDPAAAVVRLERNRSRGHVLTVATRTLRAEDWSVDIGRAMARKLAEVRAYDQQGDPLPRRWDPERPWVRSADLVCGFAELSYVLASIERAEPVRVPALYRSLDELVIRLRLLMDDPDFATRMQLLDTWAPEASLPDRLQRVRHFPTSNR